MSCSLLAIDYALISFSGSDGLRRPNGEGPSLWRRLIKLIKPYSCQGNELDETQDLPENHVIDWQAAARRKFAGAAAVRTDRRRSQDVEGEAGN